MSLTMRVLWSALSRVRETSHLGASVQMWPYSRITSGCDSSVRASGQKGSMISYITRPCTMPASAFARVLNSRCSCSSMCSHSPAPWSPGTCSMRRSMDTFIQYRNRPMSRLLVIVICNHYCSH